MLVHLIDRIGSPTVVYGIVASTLHYLILPLVNEKFEVYVKGVLLIATALYARSWFYALQYETKLARLGKRAGSRRSLTPFNMWGILEALWYFQQQRNEEWWWKILAKNGNKHRPYTVETITGQMRLIFTVDEDNIKAILASQFSDFGKGPQFRKEWKDFLGLSIFTTDGDLWHSSRNLIRPQFIRDRVSDLHTFETHVKYLLPALQGNGNGATVAADDLFYRYTLDAATDFLLGHSVDSLQNGQAEFASAFSEVQRIQCMIVRSGPLQSWIPRQKFHENLKIMNKFVGKYIDLALELSPEELEKKTKGEEGYTFLHALASYTRDREVLRDQLVAVLLAGRDTTAATLSWLFYEISYQPKIVQKLRQEIIDVVGLDNKPTYADLKGMRYLQHTLNETLRMYPAVPYNVRVALKDTTLPRGGGPDGSEPIAVLKNTPIGYSTYVMQRRQDLYPPQTSGFPDVNTFVPERWDGWTPKSWTYIPFNGGPRICVGQQFAMTEMAYTVVRILQTYDRIENRMEAPTAKRADVTLSPNSPVKVAFFKSEKA